MIFYWLIFAIAITLIGTVMICVLEQDEEDFSEEVSFEDRTLHQRASLTVAECAANADCRLEHEAAVKRFEAYVKNKKKK
ncbi:hypothetical protein KJ611_00740 [Patescibacteria group bacterium]|nr:hypothetical protein [Patescibacteria group bacterium]MBU1705581.1 hypothetical protein [Patescibacteria group bacterium]